MKPPQSPSHRRTPLGELLVLQGRITAAELEAALAFKQERGMKLGQALVALHLVEHADIADALRSQGKVQCIHLTPGIVDREVAGLLGEERSRRLQAIAVNKIAGVVTVAMEDPTEVYNVDAISLHLRCPVFAVHAEPQHVDQCLTEVFRRDDPTPVDRIDDIVGRASLTSTSVDLDVASEEEDTPEEALDRPVINMVRTLFEEAFSVGASDVHLEPRAKGLQVRFRVDGALYDRVMLPRAWARPVLARLKVFANMDIAERRLPQDGRAQAEIAGHRVDLRIATTPTLQGEGAVIRLLDGGRRLMDLASLSLDARQTADLKRMVEGGDGIVLATGPTGHGKTTTLYALLQHINSPDTKIITIEDPVENQMDGVTQISVNGKIGLTFARGLRSILRQDPDVVLIGEVRDQETALFAVQAALTGHLVLSTLHTVGAAESITRLTDMGAEVYLLADTLRGLIAQRLVRRVCTACRRQATPTADQLERLGLSASDGPFWVGEGCERCSSTGYRGRLGLYEIMRLTPDLCSLVRRGVGADALRAAAVEQGTATLREDGLRKARSGETSLAEVYAATARL